MPYKLRGLPTGFIALGLMLFLASGTARAQELAVSLEAVAGGMDQPIGIEHADDGSDRLFVIEQPGRIVVVRNGAVHAQPFLDVAGRVNTSGNEQGLLGLAFHPNHAANGVFFIHYTEDVAGDTVIERCVVSASDPDQGDCSAEDVIFRLDQPFSNHNGGKIAFGPDEFLYIALGDGGGGGDPEENAQDTSDLHGAILRLDVNGDDFPGDPDRDYAIPPDNPFVSLFGAPEIWAFGLRNPWRFSFDRMTGDLWIGDVGQQDWEEIDFEAAGDAGGRNYGWDVLEGNHCFEDEPVGSCLTFQSGGSTLPVIEIDSSGTGNCSVTGGYRYRGVEQPQLFGTYIYGDFCSGRIWGALPDCAGGWVERELADTDNRIASFGEDEEGELYLVDRGDGTLYRVVVAAGSGGPVLSPNPVTLDYGTSHLVGDTETQGAEITHSGTGSDAVVVEVFGLSDADHFQVETGAGASPCGTAPVCLQPGESCTLGVTFEPQREGGFDDFLSFLANSPPAPVALEAEISCTEADHRLLESQTVTGTEFLYACQTITGGNGFTVADGGRAELRAGDSVALQPGASVALGGTLGMVVDPVLAQP